jgi:hypothetical protein
LYNNNYWVFNPTNNGTYTMSEMGTPSSSNENWKLMVTDFKYLITEAIFGSYAHFGSFIINGDWMISQHGTINGQASTNYVAFDTSHPFDDVGTNFIPNFCIDGLTGKTYQNDALIKGNIYRPALTINNSNYSTYAPKNQDDVYVIDLKKTGLNILLDFNLSTGTLLIDLPYGDEYIGAEVTIMNHSNKCAYIQTILWGEGDASFPIYGRSGYAHFKYVKVTGSLGHTFGKWWVLGSIYNPGNYVNE